MNKNQRWLDSLAEFKGFPNITLGWPAAEVNATFDDYIEHFKEALDDMIEDDTPPTIPPYTEWRDAKLDEGGNDLGFCHTACDLCGSNLAGERYAATALPENPAENRDYVALEICTDCLMWVANGDLPFEE